MEALIFIGIQATGKSTFYLEHFFKTHIRINLDMLKTRNKEKILFKACLDMKQSFVIDNTNPTIEDRQRYIPAIKENKFRTVGYFFQSNISDSLKRNLTRNGKEQIVKEGIKATHDKLQIPSLKEGFDELYFVQIGKDNDFIIKEWQNEV